MGNPVVELKERVYSFVQRNGPVLPQKVASNFTASNLFISALLSELVANKKIQLTKARIGSSPVYYCPHQKEKLPLILRSHLGQRQKESLDLLQEKSVLRDRDLLPYERVALREITDFAKPVKFTIQNTEELFWKWFMLPDEAAKTLIEEAVEKLYKPEKEGEIIIAAEIAVQEKEQAEPDSIKPVATKIKKIKVKRKRQIKQTTLAKEGEQPESVDFEDAVSDYFATKKVKILERRVIKKGREFNLMVQIGSDVGDLTYYVKARNKKKFTEGDLLLAFTEGQNAKVPTIFIATGEITKKAAKYMEKNLRGMKYIKI